MQYVTLYIRYSTLQKLQEKMICHCFSISLQTLSHFGVCYTKYLAEFNNVLLVKIEGPVWYTIYHHLPVVKGVNKPLY